MRFLLNLIWLMLANFKLIPLSLTPLGREIVRGSDVREAGRDA
jgi:uncharacterized membrane protein YccF (DUF307 family)